MRPSPLEERHLCTEAGQCPVLPGGRRRTWRWSWAWEGAAAGLQQSSSACRGGAGQRWQRAEQADVLWQGHFPVREEVVASGRERQLEVRPNPENLVAAAAQSHPLGLRLLPAALLQGPFP